MVRVPPINLKFHTTWITILLVSGSFSLAKVGDTLSLWNEQKEDNLAHQQALEEVTQETELEVQKAESFNEAQLMQIQCAITLNTFVYDPDSEATVAEQIQAARFEFNTPLYQGKWIALHDSTGVFLAGMNVDKGKFISTREQPHLTANQVCRFVH